MMKKWMNMLGSTDINEALCEYDNLPDAVLLDVRTPQEYSEGHIPLSRNIPAYELHRLEEEGVGKEAPIFVYCRSGARSRMAVQMLRRMGYQHAKNIGGIESYLGRIEQSLDNVVFRALEAWNGV